MHWRVYYYPLPADKFFIELDCPTRKIHAVHVANNRYLRGHNSSV